jgi:hypothetical protein
MAPQAAFAAFMFDIERSLYGNLPHRPVGQRLQAALESQNPAKSATSRSATIGYLR